jgi:Raf kinase inhibitor-like YbhB/YbcL family protein
LRGRRRSCDPIRSRAREEEAATKVRSESFDDGGPIPVRCAFGKPDPTTHIGLSDNESPHLAWDDVPAGTKSFAIVCTDSEVPSKADDVNKEGRVVPFDLPRVEFVHWVLVDLPANVRSLAEGEASSGIVPRGKKSPGPHGSKQGLNDYTMWFAGDADMKGDYHGYDGPCPPWNDERLHVYSFAVYALDVASLGLKPSFSLADARKAMEGHVVGKAGIRGTYAIHPKPRPAK